MHYIPGQELTRLEEEEEFHDFFSDKFEAEAPNAFCGVGRAGLTSFAPVKMLGHS